ncbi:hypothetical protein C0Q70_09984 [Pomacea canaliculata]|uniref:Uncharacterized protein n=1 Tax=Pomacea canaliculata TaxID=400727 RepID=A0A2T7PBC0_POMCA|nr:hypothetical protein C0Q70_09984 [Pomacea canaliculata]
MNKENCMAHQKDGRPSAAWRSVLVISDLPLPTIHPPIIHPPLQLSDALWSTDLDFLFKAERAHMSDIMGSINLTNLVTNSSRVVVPTPNPPLGGWGSETSLSLAFVNFVAALVAFSMRYASVFWYTNKALTTVFAGQLLAMTLNAIFGYCGYSCLYKVCYNRDLFINIDLSLSCSTTTALYIVGSAVMVLSTMTVFEYGSHYFAEKFRLVERKHRSSSESFVKQAVVVSSGCQGYVPHSCAMAALVVFAFCKGPVIYELVALYRPTSDRLVLIALVCEVCYMVLWIALWFGLTVKQRWQFRILDYVPLGQPLFLIHDDQVVKNPTFDRDSAGGGGGGDGNHRHNGVELEDMSSRSSRRSRNGESPPGYLEAVDQGSRDGTPDPDLPHSDAGTEDSDNANLGEGTAVDCGASGAGAMRKPRPGRRNGGQRVTFDESVRSGNSDGAQDTCGGGGGDSLMRRGEDGAPRVVNVTADVHSNGKVGGGAHDGGGDATSKSCGVRLRKQDSVNDNTLCREYRNSIRSKCDDLYAVVDKSAAGGRVDVSNSATQTPSSAHDPLPTLMSSFRDKVKESSRAANTYKEQHRSLQMGRYGSLERQTLDYPGAAAGGGNGGPVGSAESAGKRRGIVEGELGEVTLRLDDSLDSGVRSGKRGSTVSGSDDDGQLLQLHHGQFHQHHPLNSHNFSLPDLSHPTRKQPSTTDGNVIGLPAITENGQLHAPGVAAVDRPPAGRLGTGKVDYVAMNKDHGYPRHLHIVARKGEIGRRDSANYSLASSQETSSNESEQGHGLCSQV